VQVLVWTRSGEWWFKGSGLLLFSLAAFYQPLFNITSLSVIYWQQNSNFFVLGIFQVLKELIVFVSGCSYLSLQSPIFDFLRLQTAELVDARV